MVPIPFSTFNIILNERIAALHFDECEACEGFDGVIAARGDDDAISGFDVRLFSIENKDSFTPYKSADLRAMLVSMV